jgi:hypothetical protein
MRRGFCLQTTFFACLFVGCISSAIHRITYKHCGLQDKKSNDQYADVIAVKTVFQIFVAKQTFMLLNNMFWSITLCRRNLQFPLKYL